MTTGLTLKTGLLVLNYLDIGSQSAYRVHLDERARFEDPDESAWRDEVKLAQHIAGEADYGDGESFDSAVLVLPTGEAVTLTARGRRTPFDEEDRATATMEFIDNDGTIRVSVGYGIDGRS